MASENQTNIEGYTWSRIKVRLRGERCKSNSVRLIGQLEVRLDGIFDRAVGLAERAVGPSLNGDAWDGLKLLLPLMVDAQTVLLETELNRCRAVAERRGGRACAVRFKCFDLSALDPPASYLTGSHKTEEEVLRVLLRLITAQRRWLEQTPVR